MSILSQVTTGKVVRPHLAIIYGPDGVGKTTFAAGAPKPLFLGAEDGTNSLDVARLPGLTSIEKFKEAMQALISEQHNYKTIIIDSLDWLETLVWAKVVKDEGKSNIKSIEDFGYGKGYAYALDEWKQMLPLVAGLRDKGLNVLVIAHSKIKLFQDPGTPQGYDRYQLKLHDGAAALWREFVDTVLFVNHLTQTSEEDKKRGFGDGTRVAYTERRPGWDAKNRSGLPFKLEFPKVGAWSVFEKACLSGDANAPAKLKEEITAMIEQVANKDVVPKIEAAVTKAGDSVVELKRIHKQLSDMTAPGQKP